MLCWQRILKNRLQKIIISIRKGDCYQKKGVYINKYSGADGGGGGFIHNNGTNSDNGEIVIVITYYEEY